MALERLEEAFLYASRKHAMQTRKGTAIPYISHLLAVAAIVLEHGGSADEVAAALLHDAAEDQGGHAVLEEIRIKFGDGVAQIVQECSDTFATPKPPWRERKQRHLERLRKASRSALLVTAADKLHNARAILADFRQLGDDLWERFEGGKEGTLQYYRSVVGVLQADGPAPLMEEFDRVVSELESLASPEKQ